MVGHVSELEQVVAAGRVEDLGVSDVAPVERAQKVDEGAQRDDAEILFPAKRPDSGVVSLSSDLRRIQPWSASRNIMACWRCDLPQPASRTQAPLIA